MFLIFDVLCFYFFYFIVYFTSANRPLPAYTNLKELPKLPDNLESLVCGFTDIKVLPSLPITLYELACNDTNITSLPDLPDSLRYLNASRTNISTLPTLPIKLKDLDVSETLVKEIPELPYGVERLTIHSTSISKLPMKLPDSLVHLSCYNTNIPVDRKKGESPHTFHNRLINLNTKHLMIQIIENIEKELIDLRRLSSM